ncbi:type IV pilus modification PilV family protein [Halomonas sp. LS-001]
MRTRQKGFSLLEALISLVVLSFGLIGMAGMQTKALITAQQSYLDSVATLAAVDAQERLWVKLDEKRDCGTIKDSILSDIKENWVDNWFSGSDSPLKNKTGSIDGSENANDCEFVITISASNNPLTFVVRLPKL